MFAGDVSKSIVEVVSGVETEEDVKAAIDKASHQLETAGQGILQDFRGSHHSVFD